MTFAGSPDRVEARLVPERGYEFDAFAVSGLPRRPERSSSCARSGKALAAPAACRSILRRRRPDAVLGAGGYVAGPMVLAARLERDPVRAHRGGRASRPREPARRAARGARLSRAARSAGTGRSTGRSGGRSRQPSRPVDRAPRRASRLGLRPDAQRRARLRRLARRAPPQRPRARRLGRRAGPAVVHLCGERDYPELRGRVDASGLHPAAVHGRDRRRLRRRGRRAGARGRLGLGARRGGAAGRARPGAFATGEHQEKNARWFADAGGAVVVPEAEAARAPRVVEELLGDAGRLAAMAAAMRAAAKPDAAEEIADELVDLARSPVGESGSPGSAAPA